MNPVRNKKGNIIGFTTVPSKGTVHGFYKGKFVGSYHESNKITFDSSGKIYCYDNGIMSLILDQDKVCG